MSSWSAAAPPPPGQPCYATFFHGDGRVVEGAGSTKGRSVIARTLLQEKVFAQLDRATPEVQQQMRMGQPNFFLQFDRRGINPFTDRFEVNLLAEGTVRGTGGINVVDDSCATTVPGLYAAGDAATRERICGGFTGGGSRGRWMYRSALFRTESRGMSKRDDHPELDPGQHHHILTGGLDRVWTDTTRTSLGSISAGIALSARAS